MSGKTAVPPATGYVDPSSAWINASTASMAPARIHDTSDAGPATLAAPNAPSSQPEPMIDPSDTNVRPQKPTARCRWPAGRRSRCSTAAEVAMCTSRGDGPVEWQRVDPADHRSADSVNGQPRASKSTAADGAGGHDRTGTLP